MAPKIKSKRKPLYNSDNLRILSGKHKLKFQNPVICERLLFLAHVLSFCKVRSRMEAEFLEQGSNQDLMNHVQTLLPIDTPTE